MDGNLARFGFEYSPLYAGDVADVVALKGVVGFAPHVVLFYIGLDQAVPVLYVEENKLGMVSDSEVIDNAVRKVLSEYEKSVSDYKNGNQKILGFFVGKIMKILGGKADPRIVNERLLHWLSQS